MNFSELKQKFPVSFKLFETWVEKNHETSLNIWNGSIKNEDVVTWLDDVHVYIAAYGARRSWRYDVVTYFINQDYDKSFGNGLCESRELATEAAITKAFELLEQKLTTN